MRNWKFTVGQFVYGPFDVSGKIIERIGVDDLNKYKLEGSNVTFIEGELSLTKPSRLKDALRLFRMND